MKRCKTRKKDRQNGEGAPTSSRIRKILQACQHKLGESVPGDERGRTYAEWIAGAIVHRAIHGDVRAAREIERATGQHYSKQKQEAAHPGLLSRLSVEQQIEFVEWFLARLKHKKEAGANECGRAGSAGKAAGIQP
jgi:hypothetical protein